MSQKRRALAVLSREELLEVGRAFERNVTTSMRKDDLIDEIARSKRASLDAIVLLLSRDSLKAICEALGLSSEGREKQVLIDRIASAGGGAQEDASPDLELTSIEPPPPDAEPSTKKAPSKNAGKKAARGSSSDQAQVISYRHGDKRKNNPEVGMVDPDTDPLQPKTKWAYDPHIDPALQFDVGRAQVEKLIDDALASGDEEVMRRALEQLKRQSEPYLNWTGKAERTSFEVDTVSLHVHERIDPATILSAVRKRMKGEKPKEIATQLGLFSAPFENLPLRDAIDFYKHDKGWSNRLIAGDSLLVMNSLLQKEGMAGQVQMIFIDPPYGIRYGSNFQPFVGKRDVKDRHDSDLTQEPEMLKAFRDTWELGLHSYLTYLRDRLLLSHDLLRREGSVFVQISDENVHLVRNLLDEIFGAGNCIALITFKKTTGAGSFAGGTNLIPTVSDYLLWYGKEKNSAKYHQIFSEKVGHLGTGEYTSIELRTGERVRALSGETAHGDGRLFRLDNATSQTTRVGQTTVFPVDIDGRRVVPQSGGWKTNRVGMGNLVAARRIVGRPESLGYVRYMDDFPAVPLNAFWDDTVIAGRPGDKLYVVQTATKVVERCLLMTTDPGDLVLDPTCGSGTTASVAEKWGRRWMTCDTSRVAVTLAKQRLMTASYDYYDLKYPHEGIKGGFKYKTVPHVTLKSIANNLEIGQAYERHHPAIAQALDELNKVLRAALPVPFVVEDGVRKGKAIDFNAAASKTMDLPSGQYEVDPVVRTRVEVS